ncbi:ParB/RepB/Spo0J family partition protein [Streptomyces sp. RPT161]|uniref:ParB/RepB/Spo0J family partition protein n=1 Tax=Streptomyces sp. RPT161 TaxID=3015993 RepID=UPI0022B8D53D|nr:ParB/RepB/Spo0J family partition protein [Streptomyces sp. RPT161]
MFTDFGLPPTAVENRRLVEQRLKELKEAEGVTETLRVEWRGAPLHIEVIDMPVDALLYNPGTHRIRAQRSYDSARDLCLQQDAWSVESQDYLHYLLQARPSEPERRDPDFDTLKESLREHRQSEPGLITREGILVNGNTRRAALKELGVTSMRVGVLPTSCTWDDVNAVELSLQLRPDKRRDYSYINQLMAVEEQVQIGRELSEIAKVFHTTVPALERDMWILAQLRELISRSRNSNFELRLMDLERSQEKLAELYRAYKKERNRERADLLKEARLAAIVLDFAKTDVRFIEPDFHAQYLERLLPESLKPSGGAAPAAVVIPGLNRTVQTAGAKVSAARSLTDTLLKAKAVEVAGGKAAPADLNAASKVIGSLQEAFNEAITVAGRDVRLKKKRQAAPDRVSDACKALEQAITDLVLARSTSSLDEGAFDDALIQLRTVMGKLAIEAQRSIEPPGDGLAWMIEAASAEQVRA